MMILQKFEVRTMNEAWRRSLVPERTGQYPKRPKVLDLRTESRYE
jgi:hypothetical protein